MAQERYDTLDEVVNVAQRTASYLVQEASLPEGEELEALSTKLEIIGESAEAYLFFTDCDGNVMLASVPEKLTGDTVEAEVLENGGQGQGELPSLRHTGRCAGGEKLHLGA